jgi:small-conductance mechanosensitive channel
VITIIGLLSIWFNDPGRLATFLGLFTAGLAFALQRVVTALAGYFILLWGNSFNVGDRITMGGVRGDVIALGFFQTTIMEMGEPPPEQSDAPSMWVQARQYTGRIVTVTNDKIFDNPVYNYSREFPYIWEEMHIGVSYKSDRKRAEEIVLEAARRRTVNISEMGEPALAEMERRYFMRRSELEPRVFYRLTDNWIQMTIRFISNVNGVRELKDMMSRDILEEFERAGIEIASSTYDIVGFPPVQVKLVNLS